MNPNKSNVEKIIVSSAPEYAEAVMHSYRQLSDMIARELTASPSLAKKFKEARDRLRTIEEELVKGVQEKVDPYDKKELVAAFANKMDQISYDVIQLENKPTVDVPKQKEHRMGGIYEKAEVADVVEQFSHAERLEILGALADGPKLSEKQKFRIQQIGMLKEFLSTIHWEIKEADENVLSKSTWAERWKQIGERRGLTHARILRISNMIQSLDDVERQIMEDPNKTVSQLLSGEIKGQMKEYDFTFDKGEYRRGIIREPGSISDIQRQYVALIEFMRSRGNYAAAQTLMEENLLGPYFAERRDAPVEEGGLSDSDKASAKRRARSKIGKMVTNDVLEQWGKEWDKKGIPADKHDEINRKYIEGLVEHESVRQMNKVIAKENNGYPFKLSGWEKAIQEQYRDMMGYGDWHNLADETWDMILNEVIVSAPLIAFSGGVALAGRAALSAGAAALVNSGRLASVGLRVAEGAEIAATASKGAKAAHWWRRARLGQQSVTASGPVGKALYWSGSKPVGLLFEGALFEGVHSALQGENLLDAPDWFKRILWSSATLGTLHFTAGKAKQLTDFITKNSTRLFPDKTVRNIIMKVFVSGNITAGSMLAIGAIRHGYEVGDYDDFDAVKELFRAYLLVGAIGVGHGVVRVGGKTFTPRGGKPEGKGASEAEGRPNTGVVARVREALNGKKAGEFKIENSADLMQVTEVLRAEGLEPVKVKGGFEVLKGGKRLVFKVRSEVLAEVLSKIDGVERATKELDVALKSGRKGHIDKAYVALLASMVLLTGGCSPGKVVGKEVYDFVTPFEALLLPITFLYTGFSNARGFRFFSDFVSQIKNIKAYPRLEALRNRMSTVAGPGRAPQVAQVQAEAANWNTVLSTFRHHGQNLKDSLQGIKGAKNSEAMIYIEQGETAFANLASMLDNAPGTLPFTAARFNTEFRSLQNAFNALQTIPKVEFKENFAHWQGYGLKLAAYYFVKHLVMSTLGYSPSGEEEEDDDDEDDEEGLVDIPSGPDGGGASSSGVVDIPEAAPTPAPAPSRSPAPTPAPDHRIPRPRPRRIIY